MAQDKENRDFPIVGVGASAGGLEAYRQFLDGLPADTGAAFVFIQHLDPNHDSMMAELLVKYTDMPVEQAEQDTALKPNHVYVIPPNRFMRIIDHGLFLEEPEQQHGVRLSIDHFFRSMAEVRGERAIGVLLSGTGSDGTLGMREIKAAGGVAIVQAPQTAEYDGMPRSAIASGEVDFVLPVAEMGDALASLFDRPLLRSDERRTGLAESASEQFATVLNLLRAHTDYDFRCYKKATLERRIQRRMGLHKADTLDEYVELLREKPAEVGKLYKDILIGVTRFFRDPEAWEALETDALTQLIREKRAGAPLRIWVPGCASGEEAYTLAMLVHEQMLKQNKDLDLQIFATDLSEEAIAIARGGRYPASVAVDVPGRFFEKYLAVDGDHARVVKRLRETVVFAIQNVISDPPFSNIDLISCRNLMIYLEPDIQKRMIELFHFALAPEGLLFLGPSESGERPRRMFEPLSKTYRIYRRGESKRQRQGSFPILPARDRRSIVGEDGTSAADMGQTGGPELARRILLERFAPASVLVDKRFEVQYFHGPVRNYLDFPTGEPTSDVTSMAVEGLRSKLRGALTQAVDTGTRAEAIARNVRRSGSEVGIRVQAEPVRTGKEASPLILVSFEDISDPRDHDEAVAAREAARKASADEPLVQQLEYELQATKEDLQSTIEELETANEELKASNEEVMSMNEELQSTNEELETSREELQSLNEELSTVNNQLEEKVSEVEASNNDLSNLLRSTNIATVFLDTDLCIRRFTPATRDLMRIIDTDVGRPIDDLAPRVNDPGLYRDAARVLDKLQPLEAAVENDEGQHFIRRIQPYRTADNKIEGVVVTFADVTSLRRAAEQTRKRERQQEAIADLGRIALSDEPLSALFDRACLDLQEHLNVGMAKVLELEPDGRHLRLVAGRGWHDGLVGHARVDTDTGSQAGYTLQRSAPVVVQDFADEKRFRAPPLLKDHDVVCGASVIIGPTTAPFGVLGAHDTQTGVCGFDVDDINFMQTVANTLWLAICAHRATEEIEGEREELRQMIDAVPFRFAVIGPDERFMMVNAAHGHGDIAPGDIEGRTVREVIGDEAYDRARPEIEAVRTGEHRHFELTGPAADGAPRVQLVSYTPRVRDGGQAGFYAASVDITERKREEERLKVISAELDHRVKNILATINSIARLAGRNATSLKDYRTDLEERIQSLARAHQMLASSQWEGMSVRDLIERELEPYLGGKPDAIAVEGPDLMFTPAAAQSMALVVHELATNASKYGALKGRAGRLSIRWRIETQSDPVLAFSWHEDGLKNIEAPSRKGFGSNVIDGIIRAHCEGETRIDYRPSGLHYDLRLPADCFSRNV